MIRRSRDHTAQIRDRGFGVQLFERVITAGKLGETRDAAIGVVQIAEHDRISRARLRAGWHDIAVAQGPVLAFGVNLRGLDPLDAERALFHHADAPYRDVWIQLLAERRRPPVSRPVESPDFVRAVVRAETRTDASYVYLGVQPLGIVIRRVDGTHRLARRVVALLAQHRQKYRARSLQAVAVIEHVRLAFDANPRHLTSLLAELGTDDSDVVLGIACDDTGAAPGARVEIDRHSPSMLGMLVRRIELDRLRRFRVANIDEIGPHDLRERRRSAA